MVTALYSLIKIQALEQSGEVVETNGRIGLSAKYLAQRL
jgi:hypothetical protein